MKRLLLITHEASRTGAPMVLLHYTRWLRKNRPGVRIDILSLTKAGALAPALKAAADNYHEWAVPLPPHRNIALRLFRRLLLEFGLLRMPNADERKEEILRAIALNGYDLIYANSLASIPVGWRVKEFDGGRPVLVAHIHEMNMVIQQILPDLVQQASRVDLVIAASQAVKSDLVDRHGFKDEEVFVQYEFSDASAQNVEPRRSSPMRLHVGASGSVILRKGYDLFIQVAAWVNKHHPTLDVSFTWIGRVGANERVLIEHDVEKAGLTGKMEFVGELEDPMGAFSDFDLFLLPSREDPFPLVCIEVGQLGVPMVCFEGATGTAEVLADGGGKVVPYLDVEAMGRAIVAYAEDRAGLRMDGERSRTLFGRFTPDKQCPRLHAKVEQTFEASQRSA